MKNDELGNVDIEVGMDMGVFEGVTAHMFQMTVVDTEARLDCIYVDQGAIANNEPSVKGKIVARINMSTSRLRELYDLLDEQFGQTESL